MTRKLRLSMTFCCVLILSSMAWIGCGPSNECTKNDDCKSKGADYVCKAGSAGNKCEKGTTDTNKCDPACAADETCNAGKCEKKADPNKCDPACAADETCNAGKCEKKTDPNKCDPACGADETCNNGKCEKKTDPNKCDPACGAGETCKNGKCEKDSKPECTTNNECPTGKICKDNKCVTDGGGPAAKVGEKCNPQAGAQACVAEATCLIIKQGDTSGICFKNCKQDGTCDAGEACVSGGSGQNTFNICLKEVGAGADCGIEKAIRCKGGQWPPLYCSTNSKKCEAAKVSKKGDPCNKSGDNTEPVKVCDRNGTLVCDEQTGTCVEGTPVDTLGKCDAAQKKVCKNQTDICVRFSNSVQHGYCMKECNPKAPSCGTGESCSPLSDPSRGICVPTGKLKQDQACGGADPNAEKYDTSGACETDHICILLQSGASKGICMKRYKGGCTNKCATGQACLGLQSGDGVCAKSCTDDSGCTETGTKCTSIQGGKVCGPTPETGPNDYANKCGTPVKTKGCKANLTCLPVDNQGNGFCTKDCSVDGKCPTAKDSAGKELSAQCVTVSQSTGQKACIFMCGAQGNATCPGNLKCTKLQNGGEACL